MNWCALVWIALHTSADVTTTTVAWRRGLEICIRIRITLGRICIRLSGRAAFRPPIQHSPIARPSATFLLLFALQFALLDQLRLRFSLLNFRKFCIVKSSRELSSVRIHIKTPAISSLPYSHAVWQAILKLAKIDCLIWIVQPTSAASLISADLAFIHCTIRPFNPP